jgi:hypothetical protein
MNPTEAAHVKLMLKARNIGAACMSDVVPTLTLRVAGLNVATFEPGNAAIKLLPPNGTYPTDDGVFWVVDTTAEGKPIALTMNELRAFESGAPISVAVTQVKADVLKLGADDSWQRIGDVTEYATRCDASCADIYLDMGEGSSMHELVYCGSGPSEPRVTLGDALAWCANGYEYKDVLWITYTDKEGVPQTISLANWRFVFDRETMILNGMDPDDMENTIPPDFLLSQLLLHPDSTIFGKAPRDPQLPKPTVHFAFLDYDQRRTRVCATDYQGIDEVVVAVTEDPGDGSTPVDYEWGMDEYTQDSNLYTLTFDDAQWSIVERVLARQMDPASGSKDVIKVIVRSIIGESQERPFGLIPPNPRAVAPIIDFVRMDVSEGWLYARVRPDENYPDTWHQTYPVDWVKAFHPAFTATGGVIKFGDPPNRYEDYHGYICELPKPWYSKTRIKIVAYVAPGVYSERWVTPSDISSAHNQGNAQFHLQYRHGIDGAFVHKGWVFDWLDVDDPTASPGGTRKMSGDWLWTDPPHDPAKGIAREDWYTGWDDAWAPTEDVSDFYSRYSTEVGKEGWKLFFHKQSALAPIGTDFDAITAAWAESQIPPTVNTDGQDFEQDLIWLFKTSDGRVAKLLITKKDAWDKSEWYYFFGAKYGKECKFSFRYVVFDSPTAIIAAPTNVLFDKDSGPITLDGSASKGKTWTWTSTGPAGHQLLNSGLQVAKLVPAAPTATERTQIYDIKLSIDSGQAETTKTIIVQHTEAIIGTPDKTVFNPGDVVRAQVPGGTSISARTFSWAIVGLPNGSANAKLEDVSEKTAVFKPDVSGDYRLELTINKGDMDAHTIERTISVTINP